MRRALGPVLFIVLINVVGSLTGWSWLDPRETVDSWVSLGEFVFGWLLVAGLIDFLRPPSTDHRPLSRVRTWALAHPWPFRAATIVAGALLVLACEFSIGSFAWEYSLGAAVVWVVLVFGFAALLRPKAPRDATDQT